MSELDFTCIGVTADRYSAGPQLLFKLRITESTGAIVHAMSMRCQIRIEPHRRRYSAVEAERLVDLFGHTSRWGDTLKPLQFSNASAMLQGFTDSTEVDVQVPITYDFEVASAKYFHGLEDGEVPLLLLFSGTVFTRGETGFAVEQIPWHKETNVRMPVAVWREAMDQFFGGTGWVRLRRETFDALSNFRARGGLTCWEDAVDALLVAAGEASPDPAAVSL